jgi:hypothetical protein
MDIHIPFVYTLYCSCQGLVTVLRESLCERIAKFESSPSLKDARSLVRVEVKHETKQATLLVHREQQFLGLCRSVDMKQQQQRRGTVGETQHGQKVADRRTLRRNVRFEVFTAVTMNNVVFWDIKPQFVLHRRYITSPLQSPAG